METGDVDLADIQYDIRQDDDAFVDVILMETGDVDGDGSCQLRHFRHVRRLQA